MNLLKAKHCFYYQNILYKKGIIALLNPVYSIEKVTLTPNISLSQGLGQIFQSLEYLFQSLKYLSQSLEYYFAMEYKKFCSGRANFSKGNNNNISPS